MEKIETLGGDSIQKISHIALQKAYRTKEVITFDFNGVRFIVFNKKNLIEQEDCCCFCETNIGALIKLHQGWCCPICFEKYIIKGEK